MSSLKALMYASMPEATVVALVAGVFRKERADKRLSAIRTYIKDEIGLEKNTLRLGKLVVAEINRQTEISVARALAVKRNGDPLFARTMLAYDAKLGKYETAVGENDDEDLSTGVRLQTVFNPDVPKGYIRGSFAQMLFPRSIEARYKRDRNVIKNTMLTERSLEGFMPYERMMIAGSAYFDDLPEAGRLALHRRPDGTLLVASCEHNAALNSFNRAIATIVRRGHSVDFDRVACLYYLNGQEFTPLHLFVAARPTHREMLKAREITDQEYDQIQAGG